MKRRLTIIVLVVLGLGVALVWLQRARTPPTEVLDKTIEVTVLHVNDSHGQIEGVRIDGRSVGGYARLATLVNQIRAQSGESRVFLIHAGDVVSRGDDLTRRMSGAANVAILNHLKFDVWTPGNGEFYGGVDNLRRLMEHADFPLLTSNVTLPESGECLGRPYVIEKAGPVKVAFFGLCTVRTFLPGSGDVNTGNPIETAKKLVPKLREQADLVVAVNHISLGSDKALAAAVPGIDLILGGHSHSRLDHGVRVRAPDGREVLICQAGDHLQFLGRVDLKLEHTGKRYELTEAVARLIPLDENVKLDAGVKALIARLHEGKRIVVEEPATVPE